MIDPGEETVPCPYNRAHVIIKSRMQFHLPRCRAQHPNMEKATCPYNATHIVNHVELTYHKENCSDRRVVDSFIYKMGDNAPPVGLQPVRNFSIPTVSDEDWDSDGPSVSVLDQVKEGLQHKGVLINKIGAPRAERRAHRFNERLRYQAVTSGNPQLKDVQSSRNASGAPVNQIPQSALNTFQKPERFEPSQPEENLPPKHISSAVHVGERSVNASDFPVLGRKGGNTSLTEKMSTLGIGNSDVLDADYEETQEEPLPPPSAWARPLTRNQDEKISWPTASARAPSSSPTFGSPRNAFQAARPGPAMPSRTASNPWATNLNQQRSEPSPSAHLVSAAPPRAAAPPPGVSAGANPAVNGIWARGIAFNNTQARMTSEDFPTLLPISARGRKPRP